MAAEGLIELGIAMQLRGARDAASIQLGRALQLAEERGAIRTAARAKLQSASLLLGQNKTAEALALAQGIFGYLQTQRYRRLELTALTIMSRAYEDLGQFDQARTTAQRVLDVAEQIQDDPQIATALDSLAAQSATLGLLPEALRSRDRAEAIHRRQGDQYVLPFDLTNRAELLIRLGRGDQADAPLQEVEAGIAKGIDSYVGRTRRIRLLRALRDTIVGRYDDAARAAAEVGPGPGPGPDGTSLLAAALVDHASARRGRKSGVEPAPIPETVALSTAREIRYWRLAAHVARRGSTAALQAGKELLDALPRAPSDELEWRTAALGAIAARQAGEHDRAQALARRSREAWQRLTARFKADAALYAARPDVVELVRESGVGQHAPVSRSMRRRPCNR